MTLFRRDIPRPFILPQAYIITLEESDKEVDQEGKSFPKEVSKLSKELSTEYKDWLKPASPRASPRGLSEFLQEELSFHKRRNTCRDVCSTSPQAHVTPREGEATAAKKRHHCQELGSEVHKRPCQEVLACQEPAPLLW